MNTYRVTRRLYIALLLALPVPAGAYQIYEPVVPATARESFLDTASNVLWFGTPIDPFSVGGQSAIDATYIPGAYNVGYWSEQGNSDLSSFEPPVLRILLGFSPYGLPSAQRQPLPEVVEYYDDRALLIAVTLPDDSPLWPPSRYVPVAALEHPVSQPPTPTILTLALGAAWLGLALRRRSQCPLLIR